MKLCEFHHFPPRIVPTRIGMQSPFIMFQPSWSLMERHIGNCIRRQITAIYRSNQPNNANQVHGDNL
jgi:hypothetical protein